MNANTYIDVKPPKENAYRCAFHKTDVCFTRERLEILTYTYGTKGLLKKQQFVEDINLWFETTEAAVRRLVTKMESSNPKQKTELCGWLLSAAPKSYLQEVLQFIDETKQKLKGIKEYVEHHPIKKSEDKKLNKGASRNKLFVKLE